MLGVELSEPLRHLHQRDVQRTRNVPCLPFIVLSYVEHGDARRRFDRGGGDVDFGEECMPPTVPLAAPANATSADSFASWSRE